MSNRSTTVRFPVFRGYEVHVILAASVEATGRRLHEDLTGAAAALITKPGEHKCWLVLERKPDPATIAHESSHAIRALLDASGATIDDETFAYHLDYLVGRIHQFVEKGKKR